MSRYLNLPELLFDLIDPERPELNPHWRKAASCVQQLGNSALRLAPLAVDMQDAERTIRHHEKVRARRGRGKLLGDNFVCCGAFLTQALTPAANRRE